MNESSTTRSCADSTSNPTLPTGIQAWSRFLSNNSSATEVLIEPKSTLF